MTYEEDDETYDPEQELASDKPCYACEEPIRYGEDCVLIRLVYPAPNNRCVTLLDALEEDGAYTAEPLLFCYTCWEVYIEDLRYELGKMFIAKRKSVAPSPRQCSYCHTPINWGNYCALVSLGSLDISPRTNETTFVPADAAHELTEDDLVCMDCLEWMNDDLDTNVWRHMWTIGGGVNVPEHPQRVPR